MRTCRLVTLAIQNAALAIVMHYSRVSTPASKAYSPAAAVLLNELIKGSISFLIAFTRVSPSSTSPLPRKPTSGFAMLSPLPWTARLRQLNAEIFAPDCLKLSIPAILYVIQNSLQFVAISNLPVASFQVAYQMKIMTTAAFSVALLGKRLSRTKWMALLFLAVGVGIVQVQTAVGNNHTAPHMHSHSPRSEAVGSAAAAAPHLHVMNPLKGFAAVTAACFTSGLAGVYFEMVLKGSKADLWVRNVQLSLFSIIPAVLPIIYSSSSDSQGIIGGLLNNFGFWAWAVVSIQVTAIVIKYSDGAVCGLKSDGMGDEDGSAKEAAVFTVALGMCGRTCGAPHRLEQGGRDGYGQYELIPSSPINYSTDLYQTTYRASSDPPLRVADGMEAPTSFPTSSSSSSSSAQPRPYQHLVQLVRSPPFIILHETLLHTVEQDLVH